MENLAVKECETVLDKVLPVVVRVHGAEHPELPSVFTAYQKVKSAIAENIPVEGPLAELRRLTNNYTLPADACEAYTKVYHAMEKLEGILTKC